MSTTRRITDNFLKETDIAHAISAGAWANIQPKRDRLAANYLAFTKLASIPIWLRVYDSAP
jgi:hypothetical protein